MGDEEALKKMKCYGKYLPPWTFLLPPPPSASITTKECEGVYMESGELAFYVDLNLESKHEQEWRGKEEVARRKGFSI